MISYAQNLEDVMLWRVLHKFGPGFYIDVGACDPVADSVTKAFYDAGWHGINIEPMDGAFERIARAREKDINLKVALGAQQGTVKFYSIDDGNGLSTAVEAFAKKYIKEGRKVEEISLQVETLAHICEKYVEGEILFLKIDVEGGERDVLKGANLAKFRPWIILVESTEPNTKKPSYANWEPILLGAGYCFVYFDGLNRFYVADEKMEALAEGFACPPNWFDQYQKSDSVILSNQLEEIRSQLLNVEMNIEPLPQDVLAEIPKGDTLPDKVAELIGNYSSLVQRLGQKETELVHCKQSLDSLTEEFEAYKIRVDRELDACYQELYESSRHIGVLARDRNNVIANLADRDVTVATQSRRIQELEKNVHDLHHSSSWKVTRPLRFLSRLMIKVGLKK